ncbi:TetR/AcrR family transcriptional regulator [Nocardia sp. alder85J]|uniref:TetR/AcrR family transcriptional regulator n=1 Tax=Nocardia sp. alder85J TaxID=2862949 RepID=UPI001CD3D323|nr:TetR/AcrR family transcriptional regulator [Nocardia sp. alder85J]MCX4095726.1 TetR/AcrR family transcriptional regulator [Nocardia sp. alder85J]
MQPSATTCDDGIFSIASYHPSARDSETRRILTAAWRVLERSRFRSLKVRQVLAASSTSASNFYRRFPSKAHLLLALLEDEVQLVDRQLRDRIDPDAPVADQLGAWLRYNIGILYDHSRAQRTRLFLDRDLIDVLPEPVAVLFGIGDKQLSEIVRCGMQRRELEPGDPEVEAVLVGHLMRGLLTSGRNGGLPPDEHELVTQVHRFVLRALGHR